MKRTVDLGLCLTLSLVLVFGSVPYLTDMNMALAIDMSGAPATQDTTTGSGEGEGEGDEDQGDDNDDQEDDPVTQETITAGGGSEDDNDEDNSEQNNNDNNENEPATEIKDAPNCPAGQENGLFDPCVSIQACGNNIDVHCCGSVAPILSPENNRCVNAPLVDHPSTED